MANFNKSIKAKTTISYEGGAVYEKDTAEEWLNFLMSCMLEDRFYEDGATQTERYLELTKRMAELYGNEFIAKASMFARNELGMRSIAQLTAAWLNDKTFDGKRRYFKKFCHRADDVAETLAAIEMLGQKRSHAAVRGFGDYLSDLSEYAIDKYKMDGKAYNMFDCINLCHPKSKAVDAYKNDTIKSADTWEQKISASTSDKDKAERWYELVMSGDLGYLALLRNLRNIFNSVEYIDAEYQNDYIKSVLSQIVNEQAIRKSLVFPYQIYSAYKALYDAGLTRLDLMTALSDAFVISVQNMPKLDGRNVIMLDVSGSMECQISENSSITIKEAGAVYAAAIYYMNPDNTTIIKFGTDAKVVKPNRNANVFYLVEYIEYNDDLGYGTDIEPAFNQLTWPCDRIFLISDMQLMTSRSHWISTKGISTYNDYVGKYGDCKMYSFDLGNYHTQVANPKNPNVHLFTALSSKVFDFIELKESDVDIVKYINENYYY